MKNRVLIVEDELIIALDLEDMISDMGYEVAGLSSNLRSALELAPGADIALVDINLSDGATGPDIGRVLAERFGISVVFMTGNAEIVKSGVNGTLGVVSKPVTPASVEDALNYAVAKRTNPFAAAPATLTPFAR